MPRTLLTDISIRALKAKTRTDFWDAKTPAFGVRVGKNSKTFVVKRGNRRLTIGRYGLYSFVSRQVARLPTPDQFASQVMQEFSAVWESPANFHIRDQFRQFASELYRFEQYTAIPPFPADYSPPMK